MKYFLTRISAALLLTIIGCAAKPHPITVPLADASLFVDEGGRRGIPIVFIHGNGGSAEQWRTQLEHFRATGRRTIAIDLPGFGHSTAPASGDVSLAAMAAAIDHAVQATGVERFIIVGHSYGGAVVAAYAAAHSEKIAGVVYVDAAAAPLALTQQQKDQFGAALRANKMTVVRAWFTPMLAPSSDRVKEQVFASAERTSADILAAALMSLGAYDAKTLINAYRGPRLAIVASDLDNPASFQHQFPDIHTVKISGAGHWLMLDKPEELDAALDAFVATIS